MNIQEKIEELRAKPEHVRVRYAWAMLAVSMLFVLMIWTFSIKQKVNELFADEVEADEAGSFSVGDSSEKPSLNDLFKDISNEKGQVLNKVEKQ